jgi:hypothetical protein
MTIEYREFEVREVNEELRQVSGLAVPYGQSVNIGDYKEQIQRGAFGTPENVALFYGHNHRNGGMPIGKVVSFRDTDEGLEIDAVISKTRDGDEVYTLLKDGVLNRFSVGFEPVDQKVDGDTVVRTKALLREVSIVPMPAYAAAKVSNVRSDERSQTQNTEEEVIELTTNEVTSEAVAEIREAVTDLERKFAGFSVEDRGTNEGSQFRSGGEFLKALADNDSKAAMEIRAYTGATSADSHTGNDWKNNVLRIVDRGRPVLNLFAKGPLGPTGNSVEYPKVSSITGDVAAQAAEGDDLAYIEVAITTATAQVKPYGGFSQLTRQAIERSDVSYLDAVLRAQAASYAKVTNGAVRTAMTGATPQTGTTFTLASATGGDFLKAVVDGVQKIDTNGNGAAAEFVIVSADVLLAMAALVDSAGRPVFNINTDGVNTVGTLNVRGLAGTVAGLPLYWDSALAAKTLYVASSEAVTSWESPGAPVRLEDENIINLSKDFSLYGYMAVGVTNALGLVKPTIS